MPIFAVPPLAHPILCSVIENYKCSSRIISKGFLSLGRATQKKNGGAAILPFLAHEPTYTLSSNFSVDLAFQNSKGEVSLEILAVLAPCQASG